MKILFFAKGEDNPHWLRALQHQLPDADIRLWDEKETDAAWQADYALVWKPPVEFFHGQHGLKAIINLGAGVDSILALQSRPADVPLLKLRDAGMAQWILDYVRYGLLHFGRDFDHYRQDQVAKHWHPREIGSRRDWPLGILGAGAIGAVVAETLASEGYPVRCWSRTPKQLDGVESFAGPGQLADFLDGCRGLISILPATRETRYLIGDDQLSRMQADGVVISCGRGEVFDEQALADRLRYGRLRGALLDVFHQEPLPATSELWGLKNLIITPHIAAPTPIVTAVEQIAGYIAQIENGEPVSLVDPALGY
ncbi:2-hydroxyacid dehydrogenase [Marinobacterium jannaschii]|uniref:2-hydroxyacid dehydrogenase n=1 Tax=Marinobacterium jannaschii TaxID=64970 RepID=UPI0004872F4C|nr:glyoxylate/hydroxypyruvate reductase A [Marinobacterium jannaschii]